MASAMAEAVSAAQAGINQLKSMFSGTTFSFSQHIAVPHFSMSGKFNAETGSVPTVGVSWYRKAARLGARFTTPQIIGVGDNAGQAEMLLGENTLYSDIRRAVREENGGWPSSIVIPVYIGKEHITDIVLGAQEIAAYRSGGR